jgi:hypothetical protein
MLARQSAHSDRSVAGHASLQTMCDQHCLQGLWYALHLPLEWLPVQVCMPMHAFTRTHACS